MFRRHVTRHLSAYLHEELPAAERRRVQMHLEECGGCRAAYEEVRFGAELASKLSITSAPDGVWRELHAAKIATPRAPWVPRLAGMAVAACVVLAVFWFGVRHTPSSVRGGPAWTVETAQGTRLLHTGETLQTDSASQATVAIANIGRLQVEPNTKLRLLVTKSDEHRVSLEHGRVQAQTWAPPRLFIIDTPSATAVDLGCQYTLEVEKDGGSLLHVTLGMVSLENRGRSAFVPAQFLARTQAGAGPGTPFREDASVRFQSALNAIDFGRDKGVRESEARWVVAQAQDRDAVTLWHLISRVGPEVRGEIYDRLAITAPPPPEVTRTGILSLDSKMLRSWGKTLPELFWMKENTHDN
jgi:ferric-dicitrate binding protein FerR (iron transport regulator)